MQYDEPAGTLRGAYSYVLCNADAISEPTSTAEVAAAIKAHAAAAAAAKKALKLRVTQRLFHSSAAFTCPAQAAAMVPDPWKAPERQGVYSALLVQNKLNRVLSVDSNARQMRVGPGIQLWQLAEAAAAAGLSVPIGSLPVFGGLTLGGSIAAGAHGSGANAATANAPIDFVTEIVWVDASGSRRVTKRGEYEWNAMYAGLGLVGVMTEIVVQLKPKSHTKFETRFRKSDQNMVSDIEQLLKEVRVGVLVLFCAGLDCLLSGLALGN